MKEVSVQTAKNIVVLVFEIIAALLMVFNILPREMSLFVTGVLVFYFIFSPLADSLWTFIASIPLFTALPFAENFDSMANWRGLLAILFLVLFWRLSGIRFIRNLSAQYLKEKLRHCREECLMGVFFLICILSLCFANNVWVGIKKMLFLINILLLFFIIRVLLAKIPQAASKVFSAICTAAGITLAIGYTQLIIAFFIPLHRFWILWTQRVIPVFYGKMLARLLSYSNTWFSYYAYQPPTLRMFSVFPDSHSFAFFCILALPLFLTFILLRSGRWKVLVSWFFLILCLLAILFSGSRGAWASAFGVLALTIGAIFFFRIWRWQSGKRKIVQLTLGCLIIFFLLIPISSQVLFLAQRFSDPDMEIDIGSMSFFERARSIADFTEKSAKSRLEIWRRTIDSIAGRPIMGIGIGNYPLILREDISSAKKGASAHNLYLDFAAEIGVFGLLVLLAVFWQMLRKNWLIFRGKIKLKPLFLQRWAGFFLLALLWILSYSLFDIVLLNDKVFLFFIANLGLLYAAIPTSRLNRSSDL